jgi:lysozyme
MTRSISAEGLALIKGFEGFRAEPAQLPDGAWVVGYGHVRVGDAGAPLAEAEAAELLALDLGPVERSVAANTFQSLTQGQFDALCSFAFSVGVEAFEASAVLRRVNAGDFIAAACAMDAWRKSDVRGELEIIDALVRRRAAEKALFLSATPAEGAPSAFVRAKLDFAASVLGAPDQHKPAPKAGSILPLPPKSDPTEKLVEILKSEPATEALLLTRIATDEEIAEAELVTAHAKPVARSQARALAAPRIPTLRALRMPSIDFAHTPKFSMPKLAMPKFAMPKLATPKFKSVKFRFLPKKPAEAASLAALMGFGACLVALGAATVVGGRNEWSDYLGAAALAAPGAFAMFLSGYALAKGPARQAA